MENGLTLSKMVQQFESAEELTQTARRLSERDRDYYDEKQLTADEEAELRKRGQPIVVKNRIKRKVNAMLGLEKQTRKDPKAFPRNPDDEQAAAAATDALRYVCDASRWDDLRSQCAKDLAIEGTCAVMVGVKQVSIKASLKAATAMTPPAKGIDPSLKRIPWDRFYADPHSVAFDFADAGFMGQVVWMDLDDALGKYPDAKEALETTLSGGSNSDTYDDVPKFKLWADARRRRVRLCEHYYLEDGVWMFCIFTKGGYVVEPEESPYSGEEGPECPIKAVSLYIDREGNRYGEVRTMIGPQDEVNKRSSKALHLISERQVRVSRSSGLDAAAVRKELSRADGVFVADDGELEVLSTNDMARGNLELLQEAKSEIDLLGPNSALQGKATADLSGRAMLAQQQGGMTELASFLDCIKTLSLAVYRSTWNRIRQHWDGPRWIRVTDDQRDLRFVGINQPITVIQAEAKKLGIDKANMGQADPQAVAYLETLAGMPVAQQVVGTDNAVAELDVDIILDEGLDTPTVAAEQFDMLGKMLPGMFPQGAPPEAVKMLIEASSLRNKDKLLEIFEPKDGQQGQPPPPSPQEIMAAESQAAQQKAVTEGQVKIEVAKIGAAADIEVAQIKVGADHAIKQEQMQRDTALNEQRMMAEGEAQARVDEATGATQQRSAEASDRKAQADALALLAQAVAELARPKVKIPVRDDNGFIVAVQEMSEAA